MARIRNIKPDAFTDADLGELPPVARWFYAGLWTQADCEGLLEDKPKELKTKLIPYDNESGEEMLELLQAHHRVVRYQADGRRLIWIPKLKEHQKFHKDEKPRGLPPPPADAVSTTHQHPASTSSAPCQHPADPVPTPCQQGASRPETETETETIASAGATAEAAGFHSVPEPQDFEPDESGEFQPTAWGFWGWHNQERAMHSHFHEPTPPTNLKSWHDAAVAQVGIQGLITAYRAFLADPEFATDRGKPFGVFQSPQVWAARASARKPKRRWS